MGDINVGLPGLASFLCEAFMPGYTLVDLFTSYRFDSGFEIGATVVNLFDTDYTPAYHADCSVWSRDTDKLLRQQSFKLQ